MTTIAILGSGRVAANLAGKLSAAGHSVLIGTRDPAAAPERWTGPPATFTTAREAAERAEVVVNATPGDSSPERLRALRDVLRGKVLVDIANATRRGADGLPGGLCFPNGSLAEVLQDALPETRVVKTLNTMLFTVMTNPRLLATPPTAFLSGDDPAAKDLVRGLLGDLGWPPEWIEDLGDIGTARGTEALVLLVPALLRKHGPRPFALTIAISA
ncbi:MULTISPECIES: NADPH-dependent F420 reductase [unclassified Crossiella]|uniref:NADPH-dependent F420 reductase n=1 Tax=unclassified Crossiella TaxID=2620835 RepID=UPI001FFE74CC|nr:MULTISPECIES: NAD(P)-binding domain-containing protein [unclassified Crossiella]MCK2241359.1 NAD(P)-binding domain-containing protein [Crossiella sp. S99.2]MCK2253497.1 NAD(P)-binding domain-containing protein [Crossiella sp. S99.1]